MKYKKCNRHHIYFPEEVALLPCTEEYFYKNKTNHIDGLYPYCKRCAINKATKWNVEFSDHIKVYNLDKKHIKRGIKPPFNYMGNKYYMYEEIREYFPEQINTFVDLMCGSGMIGFNSDSANIILNDIDSNMIKCLQVLYEDVDFLEKVKSIKIESKEQYSEKVEEFNQNHNPYLFYVIVQYGFNQTPIYNKKGDYCTSYANGLCYFNNDLINRTKHFQKMIQTKIVIFKNQDYSWFYNYNFKQNDFVFIDPPYFNSEATYNFYWTEQSDVELCAFLDFLNENNIKFGMTNDSQNKYISEWSSKYNVIDIQKSKYKTSNRTVCGNASEIYIYNY